VIILLLILAGCFTGVKHYYVGHAEKAYIHTPSEERGQWITYEVEGAEYKEDSE